jgi:hypothetical protein
VICWEWRPARCMKTDSTAPDQLLPHKEELEMYLKNRLGELFDLNYDLLLYDVPSTYFEERRSGTSWPSGPIRAIIVLIVSR